MNGILQLEGVRKSFGGLVALNNIRLSVKMGEIHGLIGPNGSGKTTLLNVISGLHEIDAGRIELEGKRIDGLRPNRVTHMGIGRTFQIAKPFMKMTVLENLLVPGFAKPNNRSRDQIMKRALELLEFSNLICLKDEKAGHLSGGQQKILECLRAFMTEPKVMLVDEPFAGFHPDKQKEMSKILENMCAGGLTVLIISHDIPSVMTLCDTISVLVAGEIVETGSPEQIRGSEKVVRAYLGSGKYA